MAEDPNIESKQTRKRKGTTGGQAPPHEDIVAMATQNVTDNLSEPENREIKATNAQHKRVTEREKARHLHEIEAAEALHRRWKESAILLTGSTLTIAICIACLAIIFVKKNPDDLKKTALAGLFSLLTAALGFVAGKGSGKPN